LPLNFARTHTRARARGQNFIWNHSSDFNIAFVGKCLD